MEVERIEAILGECERALEPGGRVDLQGLGFWKAVGAVKRRPELVERYADRIASIDRRAFEAAVSPTLPPALGTTLLTLGTMAGLGLVAATYRVPAEWQGVTLLAGTGVLLGTTHDLGHLIVGKIAGIRFTHWFLDGPARVQPGLKLDYGSYLRTPPRARAWMHASGALVTKIVPFALLGAAFASGAPFWAIGALVGIGTVQIATDLLYSVHSGDWKRYRREMRVARELETAPSP